MYFFEKEFHPVIEEIIIDYSDNTLSTTEREAFVEVLAVDDDLRQLAFSAKEGKKMMDVLREMRLAKG